MGRKSLSRKRRAQILEAFYTCVQRDGLGSASIRRVAQEAGVQPGIIHHYFSSKDEMIEELVLGIAVVHTAEFREYVTAAVTPGEKYVRAVDFLFGPELFSDDAGSMFYDFWSEAKRNEKVRESFVKVYHRFREIIIEIMKETGMASGMGGDECTDLASMIIAMYEGVMLQWDLDRDNVKVPRMKKLMVDMIESYIGE